MRLFAIFVYKRASFCLLKSNSIFPQSLVKSFSNEAINISILRKYFFTIRTLNIIPLIYISRFILEHKILISVSSFFIALCIHFNCI